MSWSEEIHMSTEAQTVSDKRLAVRVQGVGAKI